MPPYCRINRSLVATALVCGCLVAPTALTGCAPAEPPGADTPDAPAATPTPVPSADVFITDDHSRALPFWVSRGVTGATLVHVDAHDDFRAIADDRLAPVLDAAASADATGVASLVDAAGTGGGYNLGNFVYAAARAGIVDRIVWVVPSHKGDDVLAGWQDWLRAQRYPERDVQTFTADGGGVTGTLLGVPFTIVTIDGYMPPAEPVLLDIDADFFPLYSAVSGQADPLGPTRTVLSTLLDGRTQVQLATVAASATGDYLDLRYAWLAEMTAASLLEPSLLFAATPPVAWGAMGEANALQGVDETAAAERWREAIAQVPASPAAWYGLGRSLLALGDEASALDAIGRAAGLDPMYANGWIQTASDLAQSGDVRALPIIERARGLVDPFHYAVRHADVLYNLERYADAAREYEALSRTYDHPDVWMYLGDAYARLGRTEDATRAYVRGEAALAGATFRSAQDYPDALPSLGRLAEDRGDTGTAITYYQWYLDARPGGPDAETVALRLERLQQ